MSKQEDGSVIIKARIDVSKADKDLAKMKGEIVETEKEIEDIRDKLKAADEDGVFKAAALDAEKAKLAQMKKDLQEMKAIVRDKNSSPGMVAEAKAAIPAAQDDISDQQTRVRLLQTEYNKLDNSVQRYKERLQAAEEKLDQQKADAGELEKKINSVSKASRKMAEAQEKAEKNARKFGLRLKEVVRSALVFTLITKALAQLRDWVGGLVKTNDEALASVARLKAALLTMAQPLVDVVIPAFVKVVDVLTGVVIAIGKVFSALSGKTYEESKKAAEELNKEKEALDGIGEAAKEAQKQLASFDEINKIGESSKDNDYIAPDFSGLESVELPEWLTSFTVTLGEILFKWKNLTAEDVVSKVVASLNSIAGMFIGFSVGGIGGAVMGMVIGASASAVIGDLLFDGNGEMDKEEILKSLCTALTTVAGTVLGFKIGGAKGAAIGTVVGSSISATITSFLFDGDGQLNTEEILSTLCSALGALVGGVIGFKVGKFKGAALGASIGTSIGALVSNLLFDGDGKMSDEEIIKSVCTALGAIAGGVLGFFVGGGPKGAALGVYIGAALTAGLTNLIFDGDGNVSTHEILKSLCAAGGALVGGLIGFFVGGPGGAVIGLAVGAALTITLEDIFFKGFSDLKEKVPNFTGIGPDYSWMFKSTVTAPGLATGSVIPPNRQFLAVLGDNKTETEVVSPLSTMKQAMLEAMRESGGGGETTLVLEGDLAALARVLRPYVLKEDKRVGVSIVTK